MQLEKNLESIFDSIFDTDVTIGEENAQEPLSEQLQQVQNSLKPQYMDSQRQEDIYKQYQENRLKASQGMMDIIKGAEYGITLYKLFFKAVEVIDSLVDDGGVFVDTVRKKLNKVSEQAIQNALDDGYSYVTEPQKAELSATKSRLENLKKALIVSYGDNRARIENAIKEHEDNIQLLENVVGAKSSDDKN